jgi:hypothetical protein
VLVYDILGCVARIFIALSYCLVLMRFSGLHLPISLCIACTGIPQSYVVGLSETDYVSRDDLSRARFFSEFSVKVGRASAGNVLTRNEDVFLLKNFTKK